MGGHHEEYHELDGCIQILFSFPFYPFFRKEICFCSLFIIIFRGGARGGGGRGGPGPPGAVRGASRPPGPQGGGGRKGGASQWDDGDDFEVAPAPELQEEEYKETERFKVQTNIL